MARDLEEELRLLKDEVQAELIGSFLELNMHNMNMLKTFIDCEDVNTKIQIIEAYVQEFS